MSEKSNKKVRIVWKDGLDNKGNKIKYQSLEEFEPVPEPIVYNIKCYHDWEEYRGFMRDEKRCKTCGKVEDL